MADFKNSRRYENLKQLSTEQLEELLRTAPFLSNGQETSEYYDAIEEVILQRETETPTGRLSDLEGSWKEFRQQYAAPDGRGLRLYPDEKGSEETADAAKPDIKNIFRKAALVAAAIAVTFTCLIAAQAAGVDVFGALAHWTEEAFGFSSGNKTPTGESAPPLVENKTYLAIQAEVDKLNTGLSVVPTWFPDGYELQEITPFDSDVVQAVDIVFLNGNDENLFLTIEKYRDDQEINKIVFEKDRQPVIEYLGDNKLFYIMSDKAYKTAVWSDGYIVVSISGPVTEETIKTMIDSIGGL